MKQNDLYRRLFDDAPPKPVERRKKPDKVMRAMMVLAVSSWVLIFSGGFVAYQALPQQVTIFDTALANPVVSRWQPQYLYYSFFLLVPSAAMAAAALHLNTKRLKRKFDRLRVTVTSALGVSIIANVLVIFNIVLRGF